MSLEKEKKPVDPRPDLMLLQERAATTTGVSSAAKRHALLVAVGILGGLALLFWLATVAFK